MTTLLVLPAAAMDLPTLSQWLKRPAVLPDAPHEVLLVATSAPVANQAHPAELLATLRLLPAIGLSLPRLWYHVGCTVHAAGELGLFKRQRTLLLGHDHTGASELTDIAWATDGPSLDCQTAALRLLVETACQWMVSTRSAYAERVIAELPGPRDSAGQTPFWQGLGRHFYAGDPAAAAALHGPAWRTHVASLLPRQPLYTAFLPAAAQAAIAEVHPAAALLREVLEAEIDQLAQRRSMRA